MFKMNTNLDIKFLLNIIALQQDKISELTDKLSINSQNSSKPPSQDFRIFKKREKEQKKSTKKRGGQPGHKGITRKADTANVNNPHWSCHKTN